MFELMEDLQGKALLKHFQTPFGSLILRANSMGGIGAKH